MTLIEPLPRHAIEDLGRPSAYPHEPGGAGRVERIQTHISIVFLTDHLVYKLRKPVDLPFLSFATRSQRNEDCLREVALNRRLAPDVYLGVAPLVRGVSGGWCVGDVGEDLRARDGEGEEAEHCVVMRRLADGRDAARLLRSGELDSQRVRRIGEMLVDFHAGNPLAEARREAWAPWYRRIAALAPSAVELARRSECEALSGKALATVEEAMAASLARSEPAMRRRHGEGRIVDGHADLRLDHIFFESADAPPIAIDCVEFSEEIRHLDPAADLAFLAMDLGYRRRPDLAETLLRHYAALSDDFGLYEVLDYYLLHRAMVRVGVAALAAAEPELSERERAGATRSARAHLEFARAHAGRSREARVVLTCGLVGSGKSTVAEAIAQAIEGVVISSDRTRKHLAGLAATARADAAPGSGLYREERKDVVYEAMLERAERVLASGRPAILDATYARRRWRDRARDFAAERGLPALLVEARCDPETTLERLAVRSRDPERVSDAGPELYRTSVAEFEATEEWPRAHRIEVETHRADWRQALSEVLG